MKPELIAAPVRASDLRGVAQNSHFDLHKVGRILKRQAIVVIGSSILGAGCGVAYIVNAVPLYTASTRILIDDRAVGKIQDLISPVTNVGLADAAVDSQVEVLRSDQIGLAVVKELKLATDPAFLDASPTPFGKAVATVRAYADIRNWLRPPADGAPVVSPETTVLKKLQDGLSVRRVGRTYVLLLEYTSASREEATRISNEFARAYLLDQLESKYNSTRRASGWLEERVRELRQQTRDADLAVQRFRASNNLLSAGGRLISDQQSSELNSQLILARADTARAKARFDRMETIVTTRNPNELVTEALQQTTFNELRSSYLNRAKRVADAVERLGPDHAQVGLFQREMRDYEKLMFDELGRIAEAYRSEYEIAKAREQSLEASMSRALGVTAEANETQVTLNELERQADAYRALQRSFMSRYEEAVQQQSFPVTDARIIKSAGLPEAPSYPNGSRVIVISVMIGAAAGAGIAFLREKGDRVFRTGAQVADDLDADFLGMLPLITPEAAPARTPTADPAPGEFASPGRMRYVLDKPFSEYAETMRSVKITADIVLQSERCRTIGVVSLLPGEGKSTTAKNLATVFARQGARVLLIDADLRNPALTRALAPHSTVGFVEVLVGSAALEDALLRETESGHAFLPAPGASSTRHTSDLLTQSTMRELLLRVGPAFDYIVVDLPPIRPVVEVRALAPLLSGLVFVVEWGRTARSAVSATFAAERWIRDRCLGIVLNKVDLRKARAYEGVESDRAREYYS